jgi:uncharacterized protein
MSFIPPTLNNIPVIVLGLGSTVLLLTNGDIMGASGILSPIFIQPKDTWNTQRWKFVFVASFIGAANGYLLLVLGDTHALQQDQDMMSSPSIMRYPMAGLLVGFGTRLGNGCTSGHGISGLARWSRRSLAAVGTFMASAMVTASLWSPPEFLQRIVTQPSSHDTISSSSSSSSSGSIQGNGIVLATTLLPLLAATAMKCGHFFAKSGGQVPQSSKMIGAFFSGGLFATGLAVSGMILPSKVMGFLNVSTIFSSSRAYYDPTLAFVMMGGLMVSFVGYQYKKYMRREKPIMAEQYNIPTNTVIDLRLLLGASCFGIGWGLVGLCPGPALFQASTGNLTVLYYWMPSFLVGSYLGTKVPYLFPGDSCSQPVSSNK